DMVQETFLKAWRGRDGFQGRSTVRAWLYAIATHGCIDFLEARRERVLPEDVSDPPHVPWLQPFPDRLLPTGEPRTAPVAPETIELAFLVTMQYLPARQRAALILCDVLEWSAAETAALLDLSKAAVNSALQRARATLRARERRRPSPPGERQEALLKDYVDATERGDVKALAVLLRD